MKLNFNYGGILQNYALQQALKRLGHEPITIDYFPPYPWFRRVLSCCKTVLLWFNPRKRRPLRYRNRRPYISDFIGRYIDTTRTVKSYTASLISEYKLDALIVGSDQVWNPRMGSSDIKDRFLQFAEDSSVTKIAYAASFGVDQWVYSPEQTDAARRLVRKFDAVSVREESGIALCRKYLDVEVAWVLDPTLLLRRADYEKLCRDIPVRRNFLMAYILDADREASRCVEAVAARRDLPIEYVYADAYMSLTIQEWLAMFRDADFVITNSFHGTVFSIIFNKPFLVLPNEKRGLARIQSLLSIFKLENRLIYDMSDMGNRCRAEVNWCTVNQILETERAKSIGFLGKHLNGHE